MRSGAIGILTTILAPLAIAFTMWVANAVTTNQSDISGNNVRIDSIKFYLKDIRDNQKIQQSNIEKLLQRK